MKKLALSTTVVCALFGNATYAAITVNADGTPTAGTLANTTQLYLSGSSAQQTMIERAILDTTADGICKTGTVRKYQDAPTSGSDQVAFLCELNAGATTANNPVLNTLSKHAVWKPNLLLYKRNNGGSLKGTVPVANNLPIEFLNVTSNAGNCTPLSSSGSFASIVSCDYNSSTNMNSHIPDFGLSDVEPKVFTTASGNAPAGTPTISPAYKVTPGVAAVFGVIVGKSLRNALQEAEFGKGNACVGSETEACMPSLSTQQVADIFAGYPAPATGLTYPVKGAGKIHQWTQLKVGSSDLYNNASVRPASAKVHICSRTIGSGTKAQFGIHFLDTACNPSSPLIASQADYVGSNESGGAPVDENAIRPIVHTMASGGGLDECMDELDLDANNSTGSFDSTKYTGARWAIGYTSLDRNASRGKSYRFIKIDGVAPTLANVANGSYHDWAESTYLYRGPGSTNPLSGDKATLVNEIINSFTKPKVLAYVNTNTSTHSFGTSGFLAVPNNVHPALLSGAVDTTQPVNPLSYAIYPGTSTNATNNCRVPLIYSTPNNNTQGLKLN